MMRRRKSLAARDAAFRCPLLLLLLLPVMLQWGTPSKAASEEPPAPSAEQTATAQSASYPGLEEVVPRATELDTALAVAQQLIEQLQDVATFGRQTEELQKNWQEEKSQLDGYGDQSEWPVNRLLNVRSYLERIEKDAGQLLANIATPLKSLEETRKNWNDQQRFWQEWQQFLRSSGAKVPRATFNEVRQKINDILARTTHATTTLLKVQEEVSATVQQIVSFKESLDTVLSNVQQSPWRRNAFPLFSRDYLRQFQPELFNKVQSGFAAALQFRSEFFQRQLWLLLVQLLLIVTLVGLLTYLKKTTAEKTDDLHFIFSRPFSAALFISIATTYLFLVDPPQMVSLTLVGIATIAVVRLACALLKEGNQRTLAYVLGGVFILSKALTAFAFPVPLYRLYLSLLALVGIPFLYSLVRRHCRHHETPFDRYVLLLYCGMVPLFIAFIAQLGGFATFTQTLINASIDTVFVMLFTLMALRISEGGLELLFNSQLIGARRFVKNLGPQATVRLRRLGKIVIALFAALYLLQVWGLYDDMATAWNSLLALDVAIGEFHLSVRMVVLISVVLYLSVLVSWGFQAFLESQIFFGKRIDRGVRDAFKKLSHYALVLIGFVTAMTMAGIELQNFAILAGAFGIGIGFGLQDIVNNFVSGLILLFERPVKVGDAVIIDGQWGAINKIGLRSTVVETWDHSELIVPNSQMISEKVMNWTLSSNVSRITITVGVRYGSDLKKVIDILNRIGDGHPAVVENPAPSAIFTEFGDSSINFELRVWVDDIKHRLTVISDLGLAIDQAFKKAHIEIPFPQRDLHLRSVDPEIKLPSSD